MKKMFALLVAIMLLTLFVPVLRADDAAAQKMFVDKKCNSCHSIDAVKIEKKMASSKAPDLSTIGSDRTAEWITKFLNKEEAMDGKKHAATWSGTPEDQKTMVDWLASRKKKEVWMGRP